MLNAYWLTLPFLLHAILMAVDEFRFHRKRGLPRWERIGHPLDTLTVQLCISWTLCVEPDRRTIAVFVALAVFSCIFVTKDESVHWRRCSAAEQWIHVFLFMLHPLVLAAGAFLWAAAGGVLPDRSIYSPHPDFERTFLVIAWWATLGFGIYQIVFWNLLWPGEEKTS